MASAQETADRMENRETAQIGSMTDREVGNKTESSVWHREESRGTSISPPPAPRIPVMVPAAAPESR